jgi:hypothetical protein
MMNHSDMIQILWNGSEITCRKGAKVESLLSEDELELCLQGNAYIIDNKGNEYGLSGTISQGMSLSLKLI